MIIFRTYCRILWKNIFFLLSYLLIFLMISFMVGRGNVADQGNFVNSKPLVAVINQSEEPEAESLLRFLQENCRLEPFQGTAEAMRDACYSQIYHAGVYIPSDFSAQLRRAEPAVEFYANPKMASNFQTRLLVQRFLRFAQSCYDRNGHFQQEALEKALAERVDVRFHSATPDGGEGTSYSVKRHYSATSYVLIATILSMVSTILADFNQQRTRARTRLSSLNDLSYQGQLVLASSLIAILVWLIYFGSGLFIYGWPSSQINLFKHALNMLVFAVACLALAMLVNAITNNKAAISAIATVLSLGFAFVSGIFVPVEFLPESTLAIGKLFPMYYFGRVAMGGENGLREHRNNLVIQLLFALFFFLLSLVLNRLKRQRRELAF